MVHMGYLYGHGLGDQHQRAELHRRIHARSTLASDWCAFVSQDRVVSITDAIGNVVEMLTVDAGLRLIGQYLCLKCSDGRAGYRYR